jgi:hypothetical protein
VERGVQNTSGEENGEKTFKGRILMIGYGSVGHCTMPMIDRHLDMPLSRVTVLEPDDHSEEIAPYVARGVTYVNKEITRKNYKDVLAKYVGRGDMVLNLSVNVSSQDVDLASRTAPSISTPASSPGRAITTIRSCRPTSARTITCATPPGRWRRNGRRVRRPWSSPWAPIPA